MFNFSDYIHNNYDYDATNCWELMAQVEVSDKVQDENGDGAEPSREPKVEFSNTTTTTGGMFSGTTTTTGGISDKELISLEESTLPTFSLPAELETPVIIPLM